MPFFENAYDFEVNGGNFYDIGRDQNNRTRDSSFNMSGAGNTFEMNADYSRQDARNLNVETNTSTAYTGPSHGHPSTYAGYGQVPPTVAPMGHPFTPPYGQMADPQFQAAYYQYYMYLAAMQHYQQYTQQFSPPAQNTPEQQQPVQPVQGASGPEQDTQDAHDARRTPQRAITQDAEQDEELEMVRESLEQRFSIQDDRDPAYRPIPQSQPQPQPQAMFHQYTSTYN